MATSDLQVLSCVNALVVVYTYFAICNATVILSWYLWSNILRLTHRLWHHVRQLITFFGEFRQVKVINWFRTNNNVIAIMSFHVLSLVISDHSRVSWIHVCSFQMIIRLGDVTVYISYLEKICPLIHQGYPVYFAIYAIITTHWPTINWYIIHMLLDHVETNRRNNTVLVGIHCRVK